MVTRTLSEAPTTNNRRVNVVAVADSGSGQVVIYLHTEPILYTDFYLAARYTEGHKFRGIFYPCQKKIEVEFPFGLAIFRF